MSDVFMEKVIDKYPLVCVDFDGVLNTYEGWQGEDSLYEPREGAREFLDYLSEKYTVYIFTVRNLNKVKNWLDEHDMYYDEVTDIKVGAVAYIDDRALKFNGNYNETIEELENFKTHWEK